MKWYARDPHRAIEGMSELNLEQCGAYNLLLDHAYARDGDVPDDPAIICRWLGIHGNKWNSIKAHLIARNKLKVRDGKLVLNGVENTLISARKVSDLSSKKARKRWEKSKNDNDSNENDEIRHSRAAYTYTNTTTDREVSKDSESMESPTKTEPSKDPATRFSDGELGIEENVIPMTKSPRKPREPYAFEAGIIKLNRADLEKWETTFSAINVRGELLAMAKWAEAQSSWFHACQGALNKKDREARIEAKRPVKGDDDQIWRTPNPMNPIV